MKYWPLVVEPETTSLQNFAEKQTSGVSQRWSYRTAGAEVSTTIGLSKGTRMELQNKDLNACFEESFGKRLGHENNHSKNKSTWQTVYDEDVLYQNVKSIHDAHFVKPENETCQQRYPGAYIVGVGKSGTRELTDFLAMHPQILIFRTKNKGYQFGKNVFLNNLTLKAIPRRMPCTFSNQLGLVKADKFFTDANMPKLLKAMNQDLKVIVIVREPISRYISHLTFEHFMKHKSRQNPYGSFNVIVKRMRDIEHIIRKTNGELDKTKTFNMSLYDESFERYQKVFSSDQILIIEANEFKNNPVSVFYRVVAFLGLEHFPAENYFVYNEDKKFYCVRVCAADNKMACYGEYRGKKSPVRLEPNTKELLREYFKPHNDHFFELIGRRFDWQYE